MNLVVIGVGSNIDPVSHLDQAKKALSMDHQFLAESSRRITKPIGFTEQPDFLNVVFLVKTREPLEEFKSYLKQLEDRLCRVRTANKFGPRTIDLDVVVWNGRVMDPDFYTRNFICELTKEVLPNLEEKQGE